jgi:hypothetical protein
MERSARSSASAIARAFALAMLTGCSDDLATPTPLSSGGTASGETSGANGGATSGSGGVLVTDGASTSAGAGSPDGGASMAGTPAAAGTTGSPGSDASTWPQNPTDPRTETVAAGTLQLGWAQLDIGKDANYDGANTASSCPDPDAMLTPGTVQFADGVWTLTGSGEGFIHGWDQGNLVYFKTKVRGDFTFTMKVDAFEMLNGKPLDGAAEALLNVREDLGYKQPTHSIIAGSSPNKYIFMGRYSWEGENGKWWHWPAWPDTWPTHRDIKSWSRLVARGDAISAETSSDGLSWQPVTDNDQNAQHPTWYPFRLSELATERYVGLLCSARNDRNYAPLTQQPGKTTSCRDPASAQLRAAARCVFSHVTLSQP